MVRVVFQVYGELISPPMQPDIRDPLMILQSLANARFTPAMALPPVGHVHPNLSTQMLHNNSRNSTISYHLHPVVSWIEHPV
jgi:hypothetical protein